MAYSLSTEEDYLNNRVGFIGTQGFFGVVFFSISAEYLSGLFNPEADWVINEGGGCLAIAYSFFPYGVGVI